MLPVMHRNQKPAWLEALLSEKFFIPCHAHADLKKNERNIFCLDCTRGLCQHCLPSHSLHKLLQIRRYVYHDVIRIEDVQKLVDCSHVQPYIINSAKVVFLNQRPQPRPLKCPGNLCKTCERTLQEPYKYCSMACKVEAVLKHGVDLQLLFPPSASDLVACSSSSSCCFTSPDQQSGNGMIRRNVTHTVKESIWKQYANGKAAAKSGNTLMNNSNDDEDDEELGDQYCSPNSVLSGITSICTPTSSGSITHDELTCRPEDAASNHHEISEIAKKPRTNSLLNKATPSIAATVSLKRRKSTPRRSPIL